MRCGRWRRGRGRWGGRWGVEVAMEVLVGGWQWGGGFWPTYLDRKEEEKD